MEVTGDSGSLNADARLLLSAQQNGWIISRCLVADSISYDFKSDVDINGGLKAILLKWLPTFDVKYYDARHMTISSNGPVVLGYKLWRPGNGPKPSSTDPTDDGSIGRDEIDRMYSGQE